MTESITIQQVLLFREARASKELGRPLWAALQEVEAYYNYGRERVVFQRSYLAMEVPPQLKAIDGIPGLATISELADVPGLNEVWDILADLGRRAQGGPAEMAKERFIEKSPEDLWKGDTGEYSRTYDADKISWYIDTLLRQNELDGMPVVVTDQLLTPPPNFRYIIWGGGDKGMVISIAPTDPKYWRLVESNRISLIKHRVRCACLSIVGQLIGLERCDNPSCFLFSDVNSVVVLDSMVSLGPEHGLKELEGRGFAVLSDNPKAVQPIEDSPMPYEERRTNAS